MIIYHTSKMQFLQSVIRDTITDDIYSEYKKKIGRTSKSEIKSWENSMQYMFKVLSTDEIPDSTGIAIEYAIPSTSKRIDFVLAGTDSLQNSNVIIIELKQWESVQKVSGKDAIVKTFLGGTERETTHPSYQAWSYSCLINDFNEAVYSGNIAIHPCAYLHNYIKTNPDTLTDPIYKEYLDSAPAFVRGEAVELQQFIQRFIVSGDTENIIDRIESGKIKPSKSLQDSLVKMLEGNQEFIMIDDQKLVYESALDIAEKSRDGIKRVLIVEGGPGTGKSVLAINLLVNILKRDLMCQYITKNSAPRQVYSAMLKGTMRKAHIDNLFKGSGIFYEAPQNSFDVLIVDESHRLNEKSGLFQNKGENQIKEIINAAVLSIFFIDENQRIHMSDIGSVSEIKKYAEFYGAEVHEMELTSQFRCNGSDGYLSWVDSILQIRETANYDGYDHAFDFKIFDDPEEMRAAIFEKNRIRNKSRIVAGYCWEWDKNGRGKTDYHDVVIDGSAFELSWNLDNSIAWAIDPESVSQVGCIHTAQGLEFDYVGVIIGEDLRYEDDKIITDYTKRASTDQSIRGLKKMMLENEFYAREKENEIIKNTYRTLLTRGMKGCYVYCVDKNLSEYFKSRIEQF